MTEDLAASVRRLLDLEAIRDLARAYAHCIWRRDADGAAALFIEDGVMDTGDRPALAGRAAIRDAYRAILPATEFLPFVHDHRIDLDGDRATGCCHLDLRATREGASLVGAGVYDDRYVRERGVWKFEARRLTLRFLVPLDEGWAARGAAER